MLFKLSGIEPRRRRINVGGVSGKRGAAESTSVG
jgi:hypothetical protein